MIFAAELPPSPAEFVYLVREEDVPALGAEAQAIRMAVVALNEHWNRTAQSQIPTDVADAQNYAHVSMKVAKTIRVRYKRAGLLLPRSVWNE